MTIHPQLTAVIVGSGPSLSDFDPEDVAARPDLNIIVLNNEIVGPWAWIADHWVLNDEVMWDRSAEWRIRQGISIWCPNHFFNRQYCQTGTAIKPRWFHRALQHPFEVGSTVGTAAVEIAVMLGAREVYLLGIDNYGGYHDEKMPGHEWYLENQHQHEVTKVSWDLLVAKLPGYVKVWNCSPDSKLESFQKIVFPWKR